jgi:hypothetical protein
VVVVWAEKTARPVVAEAIPRRAVLIAVEAGMTRLRRMAAGRAAPALVVGSARAATRAQTELSRGAVRRVEDLVEPNSDATEFDTEG